MGTSWSVALVAAPGADLVAAHRAIEATLAGIVAQMSHWEAESDVGRFNRAAAGWRALPSDLFAVLDTGLRLAEESGGAFDPCCGALVDLWGFGPVPAEKLPPDDHERGQALAVSGYDRLRLDPAARRAWQPGGLRIDLSGIAKGHAVDRVAETLCALGYTAMLVEIGGELRGEGVKPDGQPWWIALERPPGASLSGMRIALAGLSVATSGDYRRFFEHDGHRYAHSLDPRSGWPVANDLASVSVLHDTCIMADALATALLVLGPDAGFAFASGRGVAAQFVIREGGRYSEKVTPALEAML